MSPYKRPEAMHDIQSFIRRAVRGSDTWSDARQTVLAAYGEAHLDSAEAMARDIKGDAWVDGKFERGSAVPDVISDASTSERKVSVRVEEPLRIYLETGRGADKDLQRRILLATAVVLGLALAFPPFYVNLPEGMSSNLGFAFLFNPPKQGSLTALVYVPLLIAELVAVSAIGAALWLAAQRRWF